MPSASRQGEWNEAPEGTVLTREGEPVRQPSFLVSGGARVEVGGQTVAQLDPPALVGEMSVVMKQPASGCAVAVESPRRTAGDAMNIDGRVVVIAIIDRLVPGHQLEVNGKDSALRR